METVWQDGRFAVRSLRKNPGFTLAATATLALGIGGNAILYSVVNAALAGWGRTFVDADRLVMVWQSKGAERWTPTPADFRDWRAQNDVFSGLAAYHYDDASLTGGGEPERVTVARVSPELLPLLGTRPALGRLFQPDEEQWGRHEVAVLSDGFWRRRFGRDSAVVGRRVSLDGHAHTVVGVLPAGAWFGGTAADVFVPLAFAPDDPRNDRHSHFIQVVGRLRPGVTLAQATAGMEVVARRLERVYPENDGLGARVDPLREMALGRVEPTLLLLLGAVALVLLIACANVANLILARVATREREIAIRLSQGASRARLVRQFLTESLMLALLGGLAGIVLAMWGVDLAASLIPPGVPRLSEVGVALDTRVLAFTLVLSVLTGLLFGLFPALQATRSDLHEALKEGARGSIGSRRGRRVRGWLVVAETGLALVLLAGAALLVKSFLRLQGVAPGVEMGGLVTFRLEPHLGPAPPSAQLAMFFEGILQQVEALPGVAAAGVTSHRPLGGGGMSRHFFVEGRPIPASLGEVANVVARQESARSLQAMGVPLRRGRYFTEADHEKAPRVALVNEALARRFFPGADPLGQSISIDAPESLWPADDRPAEGSIRWTVVGVVGDVNYRGPRLEPEEAVYIPYRQRTSTTPWSPAYLVVRVTGEPARLVPAVRRAVRSVDAEVALSQVMTGTDLVRASLGEPRFHLVLLGSFAGLALLLSAIGIYGVISYSVAQRSHEMGVRSALGARAEDLLRLVVGEGMTLTALGLGLGMLGALALTRLLSGLLFGVSATDPVAYLAGAVVLGLVALLASYLPARRAARVEPLVALRGGNTS